MDKDTGEEKKRAIKKVISYGYETPRRDDEIDLVDLWIFFWDRRKLFLISAMLVALVGIASFELLYAPKRLSTVRSLIETRDIPVETGATPREYSAAFAKRLEIVNLPRFASLEEFNRIKPYIIASDISAIEDTNFIEIVTEAPANVVAEVSRFHNELTGQVVSEIESAPDSQLYIRVSSINRGIEGLRSQLVDLKQELRSDSASKTLAGQPIRDKISTRLEIMSERLDDVSDNLAVLNLSFQDFNPRVLVDASVTEKSTGIKKSVAYSLIVMLAIFLSIFVVVGSAFVARVRERMASRS
jgi:hypothetical protein